MLSIRFESDREWWVSSQVFERLFLSALDRKYITPALEKWRHIADANGGLSLADIDLSIAHDLKIGLLKAASAELEQFRDVNPNTEDDAYILSLEKLLTLTDVI